MRLSYPHGYLTSNQQSQDRMNAKEFQDLVIRMRDTQEAYWKRVREGDSSGWREVNAIEEQVDKEINHVKENRVIIPNTKEGMFFMHVASMRDLAHDYWRVKKLPMPMKDEVATAWKIYMKAQKIVDSEIDPIREQRLNAQGKRTEWGVFPVRGITPISTWQTKREANNEVFYLNEREKGFKYQVRKVVMDIRKGGKIERQSAK